MAKKSKLKVPKKVFGFKLSKGTRKDLKKLLKMITNPDTHGMAKAAFGALGALLAERMAAHEHIAKADDGPLPPLPPRPH